MFVHPSVTIRKYYISVVCPSVTASQHQLEFREHERPEILVYVYSFDLTVHTKWKQFCKNSSGIDLDELASFPLESNYKV